MPVNTSPNMGLPIPVTGQEPGPDYANDVNNSLNIIDSHTHLPGAGVPITPDALNISADLDFLTNKALNVGGVNFSALLSTPANNTLYESGVDLYYVDGNGNNIRFTQSGSIAGTPGNITNLIAPASATYVAATRTFFWQSDIATAAHMDFGSAIFRNILPNSTFGITMTAPAALASDYTLTLPALPASKKIMTLDASGNISAPYDVDNSTIEISSNNLQVKDLGISTAKIANNAVGTAQLANNAVGTAQIANGAVTAAKRAGANIVVYPSAAGAGDISYSANVISVSVGTSLTLLATLTITNAIRPIRVFIQDISNGTDEAFITIGGNTTGFIFIFRNGSPIAKYRFDGVGGNPIVHSAHVIDIIDPVSPSTNTYTLQAITSLGTIDFHNLRITAYEI